MDLYYVWKITNGLNDAMTWSPEGRIRRGRPEMKWEREIERVIKHKNITPEDAVNWKLWQKATEDQ
jgi:hypothetical protein